MADLTGWLANMLGPLDLFINGVATTIPRRSKVNLIGGAIADNPGADRTDITLATFPPMGAIPALNVDWSLGGCFSKTISASSVFTFSNVVAGRAISIRVTAGNGNTVTWPATRWPAGVAPTQTSGGTDVYTFFYDGAHIYGTYAQAMA